MYSLKLAGLLLRRKVEVLLQIYGELSSGLLEGRGCGAVLDEWRWQ